MDSSYIESEKKATLVGLWILLFNFLMIFVWLSYEFYAFLIENLITDGNLLLILSVYPLV